MFLRKKSDIKHRRRKSGSEISDYIGELNTPLMVRIKGKIFKSRGDTQPPLSQQSQQPQLAQSDKPHKPVKLINPIRSIISTKKFLYSVFQCEHLIVGGIIVDLLLLVGLIIIGLLVLGYSGEIVLHNLVIPVISTIVIMTILCVLVRFCRKTEDILQSTDTGNICSYSIFWYLVGLAVLNTTLMIDYYMIIVSIIVESIGFYVFYRMIRYYSGYLEVWTNVLLGFLFIGFIIFNTYNGINIFCKVYDVDFDDELNNTARGFYYLEPTTPEQNDYDYIFGKDSEEYGGLNENGEIMKRLPNNEIELDEIG